MSQINILKRAMIPVLLAGTAATFLVQQSAPAANLHADTPKPAAIEYQATPLDFPAEPAMLVPKTQVRAQYIPLEASRDRMIPTPFTKG